MILAVDIVFLKYIQFFPLFSIADGIAMDVVHIRSFCCLSSGPYRNFLEQIKFKSGSSKFSVLYRSHVKDKRSVAAAK